MRSGTGAVLLLLAAWPEWPPSAAAGEVELKWSRPLLNGGTADADLPPALRGVRGPRMNFRAFDPRHF
jgi:hypothetical protein